MRSALLIISFLVTTLSSAVVALPAGISPPQYIYTRQNSESILVPRENDTNSTKSGGCRILDCTAALGQTMVNCYAATDANFIDPLKNAGCIAHGSNSFFNVAPDCEQCLKTLGLWDPITDAVHGAEKAADGVKAKVKGWFKSIFGKKE